MPKAGPHRGQPVRQQRRPMQFLMDATLNDDHGEQSSPKSFRTTQCHRDALSVWDIPKLYDCAWPKAIRRVAQLVRAQDS